MSTIQINNLTKRFKSVTAIDDVTLTFEENKIYGLLGRNGAGKSTLLNIITNKIFADSGCVVIDGEPAIENDNALGKIYCMSEKTLYLNTMKIKEVIKWSCQFYPDFDMEYAKKLAEKFGLNTSKRIKELSTGYTSIFKIVIALSCNSPILLLDEPVLGLDANHRELFYKELIESYANFPRTIVISTHLIEEVSDIIEEVIVINQGKILINQSGESVRAMGYAVSGKATDVDSFIAGKNVMSETSLGGLKTAYILGEKAETKIPSSLEVSGLDMQKLFVQLTTKSNEKSL